MTIATTMTTGRVEKAWLEPALVNQEPIQDVISLMEKGRRTQG